MAPTIHETDNLKICSPEEAHTNDGYQYVGYYKGKCFGTSRGKTLYGLHQRGYERHHDRGNEEGYARREFIIESARHYAARQEPVLPFREPTDADRFKHGFKSDAACEELYENPDSAEEASASGFAGADAGDDAFPIDD